MWDVLTKRVNENLFLLKLCMDYIPDYDYFVPLAVLYFILNIISSSVHRNYFYTLLFEVKTYNTLQKTINILYAICIVIFQMMLLAKTIIFIKLF